MNPFDDNVDDNPFDTPENASVNASYQPPSTNPSNPFDAPAQDPKPQANPYNQPASSSVAYSPNAPTQPQKGVFGQTAKEDEFIDPVTGMTITKKQLDQKEAALQKREADLAKVEQQVQDGTYVSTNDRNFPPFLKWWAYHPDRDMPTEAVKMVKIIFYIYIATCGVYLVNFIGCLSCLAPSASQHTSSVATKIVLSILLLFILCPISFEISFFVLYKALKMGKALKFFCFLGSYIIWFIILVINIIGFDDGGSVGIIQMIGIFGGNAAVGIISLIFCILGCLDGVAMVWAFIWLCRYYKTVGLDKKAIQEGTAMAAGYAVDHKEEIGAYAANNKDALGANPYANNTDF